MISPRRVLHVIDSFDLGGAQTFLLSLMRNHDSSRFVAEVAAMHGHGVFELEFQKAGIRTYSLSPGKFPPLYFLNFLRLMHSGKFDILHFHLFGANLCAKPLAIAVGHRAIIVHDQCNDASRDQSPLLLAADALANKGASRVIAVSESVQRYLLEHEDLPTSKVAMIPNGLAAEEFVPPSAGENELARAAWKIPAKSFVIGGVGRLVPQKNLRLFLNVAAQLLPKHPNLLFVIAGSGPLESELRSHAAALGIAEKVRFLGHVTDRASLYHALDLLLMPSDFEGTPMALLEAMASGLPVLASGVDGIAEVCTDGVDALLVPPGDVNGFAEAMERVIKEEGFREMLGANARKRVLARYEIRGLVRRIETLYEEVLAEELM
jgi:glycosyltransferase involved in cell wall biosynthesis